MTNTIIIVPVNQDTRPSSFHSSFKTPTGMRIDVTYNTREQAVANAAEEKLVAGTDWEKVPTYQPVNMALIPFMTAACLAILGLIVFVAMMVLDMIDWLPALTEGARNDYNLVGYYMTWYTKAAVVALIPMSVGFMIAEYFDRKSKT